MNHKLPKSFFQAPAEEIAKDFLGKFLIHNTSDGRISGPIVDVEAYPAFSDSVSHGNKRTARTEVMYREGGYAYVYLVYGLHYQMAVVVNQKDIPDVIFIRAIVPEEGLDLMKRNFGHPVKRVFDLTKSPGNLCKSFGINLTHYGTDLTGDTLFLEDRNVEISASEIVTSKRVGIKSSLEGSHRRLRFFIKTSQGLQREIL
jgi:DNA-3-methyladenine glycosylase